MMKNNKLKRQHSFHDLDLVSMKPSSRRQKRVKKRSKREQKQILQEFLAKWEAIKIAGAKTPFEHILMAHEGRTVKVHATGDITFGEKEEVEKDPEPLERPMKTAKSYMHLEAAVKAAGFKDITDYETSVGADQMTNAVTKLCVQACAADGRRIRRSTAKKESTRASATLNAELAMVGHELVSKQVGSGRASRSRRYQIALKPCDKR